MEKRCMGCMKIKQNSPTCEHCGFDENRQNDFHQLPIGTLLRNQYRVGRVLGQGGFGITYLGFDENLETPIAIKEYYPSGMVARNTEFSHAITVNNNSTTYSNSLERFMREARSLARLDQIPGIVRVKNFFAENGTAYIIMEYLEGMDLRGYLLKKGSALPPRETLALLRPVMEALDQAHKSGVIHRDISPDNIMLMKNGRIKILDFGTARNLETTAHSTELILKHGFAPSEQYLTRGEVGPWTDVYALCATAYYCMTGQVPPSAPDRSMGEETLDFSTIPGLTPRQSQALNKGMALRIRDRYSSLEELTADLYAQPTVTPPPRPESVREKVGPKKPGATPVQPPKTKKTNPKVWILAIAAVCVCVVGLTLALASTPQHEHTWTAATCTAPGTCRECGETEGVALGHNWMEATCTDPKTCQKCGETEGIALGHTWEEATLKDPKTCMNCGQTEAASLAKRATIAAGYRHTVALRSDGTVVAVGLNDSGQCDVSSWKDIVAVSTGSSHTVGLRSDGTVVAVGLNDHGQCDVSNWKDIVAISAGENHTVGLCSDGTVIAVGDSAQHQCDVDDWKGIVAIAAGSSHTVGLHSDGTVVAAGNGYDGQCNVGEWTDIVAIAAGHINTVGLRSDGTVVAVGPDFFNQCDVGGWQDIVDVSVGCFHTVGLRSDGTVIVVGRNANGECEVGQWQDIVAIVAGEWNTVGLRNDGTVVAVGSNFNNQCNTDTWRDIRLPQK